MVVPFTILPYEFVQFTPPCPGINLVLSPHTVLAKEESIGQREDGQERGLGEGIKDDRIINGIKNTMSHKEGLRSKIKG
jgi:hypothetical protein